MPYLLCLPFPGSFEVTNPASSCCPVLLCLRPPHTSPASPFRAAGSTPSTYLLPQPGVVSRYGSVRERERGGMGGKVGWLVGPATHAGNIGVVNAFSCYMNLCHSPVLQLSSVCSYILAHAYVCMFMCVYVAVCVFMHVCVICFPY